MTSREEVQRTWVGRCSACDKIAYWSRKLARQARRRLHPGDSVLHPYRCPETGMWHLGHPSPRFHPERAR